MFMLWSHGISNRNVHCSVSRESGLISDKMWAISHLWLPQQMVHIGSCPSTPLRHRFHNSFEFRFSFVWTEVEVFYKLCLKRQGYCRWNGLSVPSDIRADQLGCEEGQCLHWWCFIGTFCWKKSNSHKDNWLRCKGISIASAIGKLWRLSRSNGAFTVDGGLPRIGKLSNWK